MIEVISCINGIKTGLIQFNELSGWDFLKTNHPFAQQCKKCIESPNKCSRQELLTSLSRIRIFIADLKVITEQERKMVFQKIKSNQTQSGVRGILAETYVAGKFAKNQIDYYWSQKKSDTDFIINFDGNKLMVEVTSVESIKENPSSDELLKNFYDKISEKSSKPYSGYKTALIIDLTNYLFHYIKTDSQPEHAFIESVDMALFKFGAIITLTSIIQTVSDGIEINCMPAPTGYKSYVGWNTKYSECCDEMLKKLIERTFGNKSKQRFWFSDVTKF